MDALASVCRLRLRLCSSAAEPRAEECEEVAAICRHLDLKIEAAVLPAPPGSAASKRVTAIRSADPFEEAEAEVKVEPRPAAVSGKVRLEERFGRKPPKPAVEARVTAFGVHGSRKAKDVEAETLLEKSQLPKLTDFYRAVVDAYPGAGTGNCVQFPFQSFPIASLAWLRNDRHVRHYGRSYYRIADVLDVWFAGHGSTSLLQEKKKKKSFACNHEKMSHIFACLPWKKKKKKLKKEAKKAEKRAKAEAEDTNSDEGHGKAKKAKGRVAGNRHARACGILVGGSMPRPVKVVDVKTCTAEEVDDELQKELEFEKSRPARLQDAPF
ncbi:HDA18 [Symbiodinium microadriaticum]|nr:HDA18 [Symbiodinium microadriaticum]